MAADSADLRLEHQERACAIARELVTISTSLGQPAASDYFAQGAALLETDLQLRRELDPREVTPAPAAAPVP